MQFFNFIQIKILLFLNECQRMCQVIKLNHFLILLVYKSKYLKVMLLTNFNSSVFILHIDLGILIINNNWVNIMVNGVNIRVRISDQIAVIR